MNELKNASDVINIMGSILMDSSRLMKERFRALFTLRNLGGESAIKWIEDCMNNDKSALLKHECAYCLGQMGNPAAVPALETVLKDENQEIIVRHEAGEALAAIGLPSSLPLLEEYSSYPNDVIAETCQLGTRKMKMSLTEKSEIEDLKNPFLSVDPAPPFLQKYTIIELENILLDNIIPLFQRYRAMFTLRNIGSKEAIISLAKGLKCGSALFKHEVAYVLGQMQSDVCEKQLTDVLRDINENEMVRHECAEALGSIASSNCENILREFSHDSKQIVRESCEVALDMCDYENSDEFQFAEKLLKSKC